MRRASTFRPLPQDDPTQRQPDITRAREWLGWEPRMQLAEGLVRTVAYFRHAALAAEPGVDTDRGRVADVPGPARLTETAGPGSRSDRRVMG